MSPAFFVPMNIAESVLIHVFKSGYNGHNPIPFDIKDFDGVCDRLELPHLSNKADLVYSYRCRLPMPEEIRQTQPPGLFWTIELVGKGEYVFVLRRTRWLLPSNNQPRIKIPDTGADLYRSMMI